MVNWFWKKFGYSDVLVLGSAFVDTVVDTSFEIFHPDKSGPLFERAPGTIRQTVGGTGYNIAINLSDPPNRRFGRTPAVGIFTYLPSKLDLSTVIIRKLKVARVGTRYVRQVAMVPHSGILHRAYIGGFVGMRVRRRDGSPGRVVLGRFDTLLSLPDLFDKTEEAVLSSAVEKTKALVIDASVAPVTMNMALNAAREAEIPVFVNAASIDALEAYLGSTASKGERTTLVAVRAHSLRNLKDKHSEIAATWDRLRSTATPITASQQTMHSNDAIKLCADLHAEHVLISSATDSDEAGQELEFAVLHWQGNVLRISVIPGQHVVNSHGSRDAACSAILSKFVSPRKRRGSGGSIEIGSSIFAPETRLEEAVNDYVKQVMQGVGATKNAPIDQTQTVHRFRELYYSMRATVGHWLVAGVFGYLLPGIIRVIDLKYLGYALEWIWGAFMRLLKFA